MHLTTCCLLSRKLKAHISFFKMPQWRAQSFFPPLGPHLEAIGQEDWKQGFFNIQREITIEKIGFGMRVSGSFLGYRIPETVHTQTSDSHTGWKHRTTHQFFIQKETNSTPWNQQEDTTDKKCTTCGNAVSRQLGQSRTHQRQSTIT